MNRITKEELLEKIFNDDFENLKGKKLRMARVRVPAKEICLAHILNPSDPCIYQNMALHIGVHEGENHIGKSIGMVRFTPWESVVVGADVAMKSANVEIGFSIQSGFGNRKLLQPRFDLGLGSAEKVGGILDRGGGKVCEISTCQFYPGRFFGHGLKSGAKLIGFLFLDLVADAAYFAERTDGTTPGIE